MCSIFNFKDWTNLGIGSIWCILSDVFPPSFLLHRNKPASFRHDIDWHTEVNYAVAAQRSLGGGWWGTWGMFVWRSLGNACLRALCVINSSLQPYFTYTLLKGSTPTSPFNPATPTHIVFNLFMSLPPSSISLINLSSPFNLDGPWMLFVFCQAPFPLSLQPAKLMACIPCLMALLHHCTGSRPL